MSKCERFSRNTTRYIGYPLQSPLQGLPQILTSFPRSFNSWYKTVLRISQYSFRTYLTRTSRDMIFMFVVYTLDLIFKMWFVFIVLALEVHGLFYYPHPLQPLVCCTRHFMSLPPLSTFPSLAFKTLLFFFPSKTGATNSEYSIINLDFALRWDGCARRS